MCERCWRGAWMRSHILGGSVTSHYYEILKERHEQGTPCTPEQQRGEE